MLATIALVVVPVAMVEWPREIARWHLAAATELRLRRTSYAAAVARMDRAVAWDDREPQLFFSVPNTSWIRGSGRAGWRTAIVPDSWIRIAR